MLSAPVTANSKIDITDLTHSVVDGNGVFDKLMKAVSAHLEQEFDKGRLKGTEYSTVYLSAMQSAMTTALQFVLGKEKTNIELDILKQSAEKEAAQVALLKQQTANLVLDAANIPKQGLLLDADKALKDEQKTNLTLEGAVITNTAGKVLAEKDLLTQRKITEEAQVNPANIVAGSVLAKNIEVLSAQATGYTRDAEQKAAKIMVDAFNIQATVDEAILAGSGTAHLAATDIGSVVSKLKTGIGA